MSNWLFYGASTAKIISANAWCRILTKRHTPSKINMQQSECFDVLHCVNSYRSLAQTRMSTRGKYNIIPGTNTCDLIIVKTLSSQPICRTMMDRHSSRIKMIPKMSLHQLEEIPFRTSQNFDGMRRVTCGIANPDAICLPQPSTKH